MEYFSEDHSRLLLSKEWLVKIDPHRSTPYFIKFYSSAVDLFCCVLVTDTKTTWFEVLTSKQFARRWRDCNKRSNAPSPVEGEEEAWRTRHIELLSRAHTLGGMADISFEIVESNYADFAFELECEAFKWRWDTIFVGHKTSAEILSKHLIMPLISVNHLAFSSPDAVADLSKNDLEKATDKVGRTARRTVDTHIRNAMSKPRVATTLRRMTALFNFIPDLPGILTDAEKPDLHDEETIPKIRPAPEPSGGTRPPSSEQYDSNMDVQLPSRGVSPSEPRRQPDSATESEDEAGPSAATQTKPTQCTKPPSLAGTCSSAQPSSAIPSRITTPSPGATRTQRDMKGPSSDSESSPARPIKKAKAPTVSSDDDSEEERRKRVAQIKSGFAAKRGPRQPLKRGGKRF
ncbi:hypothetical protein BV22DRAFT_1149218 [Leucogyrophana mollusca]|uniref:Uncharacterized protein n=1 Tax=Leucogyrophana mollusca TaxID=85980 RepID=A0ACB8BRP9_9AGAM|nr:hypothetical protein BV22DRAFT_1149218 [Leucogyrophana mollusca]